MKTKAKKPFPRSECTIEQWAERDRLMVSVHCGDDDVAAWWDDDVAQLVEDGYFKTANPLGARYSSIVTNDSVLDYLEQLGVIA